MIRHHLTLQRLASALHDRCVGAIITSITSTEKYTLDIHCVRNATPFDIRVSVDPNNGSMVYFPHHRAPKKNTRDVFGGLVGSTILAVSKLDGDRIISIWTSASILHVLLYSGGSGTILEAVDGVVRDALRKSDAVLGKPFQPGIFEERLGQYYEAERAFNPDVEAAIACSTTYYVLERGTDILFSLIPLTGWLVVDQSDDINEALRRTIGRRAMVRRREHLRSELARLCSKRIAKLEKTIQALTSDALLNDRGEEHRLYANILMAQPQPSRSGLDTLTVVDWDGVERTISLDPMLSIVENAQRRYDKARAAVLAKEHRAQRLPQLHASLVQTREMLATIQSCTSLDDLEKHMERERKGTRGGATSARPVFREFALPEGWTLFVGRNAANNDELTMRFAKQNDWWLHARGVSGSHAVLRSPSPGLKIPKAVLERAAQITAWYSTARNASWTPVIYTLKKNVRKPKGANVGAVLVEREDVVMVKPGLPEGLIDD